MKIIIPADISLRSYCLCRVLCVPACDACVCVCGAALTQSRELRKLFPGFNH